MLFFFFIVVVRATINMANKDLQNDVRHPRPLTFFESSRRADVELLLVCDAENYWFRDIHRQIAKI